MKLASHSISKSALLAMIFFTPFTVKADSTTLVPSQSSQAVPPSVSSSCGVLDGKVKSWDPFSEFEQEMARFFNRPLMRVAGRMQRGPGTSLFEPDLDIQDEPGAYVIKVDLPGMERDQIRLETEDQVLILSGERKTELSEEESGKFMRIERSFGSFRRVIPLPEEVKKEDVKAKYENGVLTIHLPKKEETKPKTQRITIA